MTWSWRLEKDDGREAGTSGQSEEETFGTQAAAETWLGEHWRELRESGVGQVVLLDGENTVYKMSLLDPE
ncbi:hypothetical protein [Actinomadura rupiterrae]|uniref:hypothetical protein n=1 Tax=Actinomadura rupiterrae TaxID=559627 RepID=UPI0020A53AEC|nr:hypothetical protein [Actinomadura rupiterrae]MCP2338523.1 ribosome modulation factor [Actinomadura rupiterrae]